MPDANEVWHVICTKAAQEFLSGQEPTTQRLRTANIDCAVSEMMQSKPGLTVSNQILEGEIEMLKGLLGRKIGMTQVFDEQGVAYPVTIIEAGPCFVTQVRTPEVEGYAAVQLGFGESHPKRLTGGELGHLKAKDLPPLRNLREFRTKTVDMKVGDKITVEAFAVGERVDVIGTSKGKGFAGVVKRHNFNGQPKTHGASDRTRAPGSSNSGTTPGRVYRGTRRSGHMGSDRVTVQGLRVILVDAERNLIGLRGAVPGPKGGMVVIQEARKQ